MWRVPTLSHVQRLVRARVCARCPYRTPGTDFHGIDTPRPCESSCGLFVQLPVLREAARQLDPMVGHRSRVLARLVRGMRRDPSKRAELLRSHGKSVVDLLEELFG